MHWGGDPFDNFWVLLGTKRKNTKHKKVLPKIDIIFCNPSSILSVYMFVPKFCFPKMFIFGALESDDPGMVSS